MRTCIRNLSDSVDLRSFDHIFYVLQGGLFLYEQLTALQVYPRKYEKHSIEYHRHPVNGDRLVDKALPEGLKGSILVIDDVWDTARTARLIVEDARRQSAVTSITFAVVAYKDIVPERVEVPDIIVYAAVQVENRWLGGCGMDLGVEGPLNRDFRQLPVLVVKCS
ncbi:hypothetical protein AUK40_00410 [Candidatus Wirthbacteria bacterium CG2_30_54_11]|uniref:Phosphoribosyltransferase domain-containing protein n=1 Tax=Candidatus Wirthbacteria bacterium CG2_30_54_11 TaxID=1817892 RepID=A0A1J5IZD3_9BACT|nr:MAG: hypothetical protein AUK40_00410 [Candidatus Wirthbacteria bacterium CG2_30_54_11]